MSISFNVLGYLLNMKEGGKVVVVVVGGCEYIRHP